MSKDPTRKRKTKLKELRKESDAAAARALAELHTV
jgi:hypothetical protein